MMIFYCAYLNFVVSKDLSFCVTHTERSVDLIKETVIYTYSFRHLKHSFDVSALDTNSIPF